VIKVLDRLVLKSYLTPFIPTFVVMVFFFLMQTVWKYIDDLAGRGIEWYYIIELLFYWSAVIIPIALPIAILLSSLTTFGNFGERYELAAMKSAGISLFRIMRPLIILMVFISGGAFLVANYVIPVAKLKSDNLIMNISRKKPAFNIRQGVFYAGLEGYSIKVGRKYGEEENLLENVLIYDHTEGRGNSKVTLAKRGVMEVTADERYMMLTLYDGYTYEEINAQKREERERRPFVKASFDEAVVRFDLMQFKTGDLREGNARNFLMMNVRQLMESADSLDRSLADNKDNFATNFATRYYFEQVKLDSAKPEVLSDDVMGYFNHVMKERAVQNALRMARSNIEYLTTKENEYDWYLKNRARHYVEWHKKFALSLACFVLFFIGAPLGAIIRKGGIGMPVVFSFIVFIIFHILNTIFEKLSRELVWEPWAGVWFGTLVLAPFGIALTISAAHDSSILSSEFWGKIGSIFKREFWRPNAKKSNAK